jgi:hypothetical protein
LYRAGIMRGARVGRRRLVRMAPQPVYLDDLAEGLSVQLVQALEESQPGAFDPLSDFQMATFLEKVEKSVRAYLRRTLG